MSEGRKADPTRGERSTMVKLYPKERTGPQLAYHAWRPRAVFCWKEGSIWNI